jgi:hypothetical protein
MILLRARRAGLEHRSDRFEQEARVVFGVLIEENLDHREYAGDRRRGGRKKLISAIGIVLAVNINIGPDDLFLLRAPFRDCGEDGIGAPGAAALPLALGAVVVASAPGLALIPPMPAGPGPRWLLMTAARPFPWISWAASVRA